MESNRVEPGAETPEKAPVEPVKPLPDRILAVMPSLGREPSLERLYKKLRETKEAHDGFGHVRDAVNMLILDRKLAPGTRGGIRLPENRRSLTVALDLQRKGNHGG
jgi:hypothetical protein